MCCSTPSIVWVVNACALSLQEQDTTNKPRGVGFEDSKDTRRGPSSTPKGQSGTLSGGVKSKQ